MNWRITMVAACALGAAGGVPAAAQTSGTPLLDARLRYEFADQASRPFEANAMTLRVRAGYQTPAWNDFQLLGELEGVVSLAGDDFNDTINGKTAYPVVPDPEAFEVNRLQLTWRGLPDTVVTVGRQRIILDNARFIGNVGFRQNEQTFDALRVETAAFGAFKVDYAFIARTQRIFGPESRQDDFNGDSHILNVRHSTPLGGLTGYGYWLDLDEDPRFSSATIGARLARPPGSDDGGWRAGYAVEHARQQEHGDAVRSYDAQYSHAEGVLAHGALTLKAGGELLTGDGVSAFQTPLATLHAFQGAADQFLVTPADGLRDLYFGASWATGPIGWFDSTRVGFEVHDFTDDTGREPLGDEIDLVLRAALSPRWSIDVQAARFEGRAGGPDDLTRVWAALEFRL